MQPPLVSLLISAFACSEKQARRAQWVLFLGFLGKSADPDLTKLVVPALRIGRLHFCLHVVLLAAGHLVQWLLENDLRVPATILAAGFVVVNGLLPLLHSLHVFVNRQMLRNGLQPRVLCLDVIVKLIILGNVWHLLLFLLVLRLPEQLISKLCHFCSVHLRVRHLLLRSTFSYHFNLDY